MDVTFVYWMTERGIKAILLSCCKTPCPIPFDCKELEFNEGSTTLYASVTAGKGSMRVERTVPKTKEEEREARREKTERMEKRRMTRESRMRLYGPKLEGGMRYMETPHRRSQYDHISSTRSTSDSEDEHSKDESGKNPTAHQIESGGRGKSSSEFSSPNRDHSSSKPHEESITLQSNSNSHHESDHKEKSGRKSSDTKSDSSDNSEKEEEEKERSEFKSESEKGRETESGSERGDDEHVTIEKDQNNEDDKNDQEEESYPDKSQPHPDHDGDNPSQGNIEADKDEDTLHKTETDKSDEDSSLKSGKEESPSEVKTTEDSDTSDKSQDKKQKEFSSQQKDDSESSDIKKNSTESAKESKNTTDLDKMSSTSHETPSTQSHTTNKETDASTTESPHPQKHIFVVGRKVFGDEIDDETRKRVLKIPKHVKQAVSLLYDLPVIRLKLHFIQQGNSLMLQEDSECTTSAKGIRFENDLEARFAEFFLQEYPTKIDMTRCIIGRKNCAEPGCKVPLKLVMLYKAEKRFPEADPGRLMLMVQDRMIDDEDACAKCCIRCWHDISTSEHIARCSERETPVLNTPPPRTFQPVVPAELAEKEQLKHPMGMTAKMNTPYSFTLNLHRSPYRLKVPEPRAPPPILKSVKKKQKPIGHPEWVGRLITWVPKDERILEPLPLSKGLKKPEGPQPKLQEVPEVPHAQERARRFYEKPPFDIKMLDSKRKRKLHRTTEEHYARFSPTARFDSL